MTNPDKSETQGSERAPEPADVTAAYQPGVAGEDLVRVLDQYLADLEAGRAPSREKLLAEHAGLASQLEPCLSGIEFIHRAARPAADSPSQLGDFEIIGEVGRGGMGVVYEARQISLDRKVALKVLRFAGVADRDAMERFDREAKTVAQLHHTNIVPIFAIGEQKGVFYYAMQFIEGRSLAAVLEQSQKEGSPLELVAAARWALQAAEALAHAHQRNVIHRDVKPSNLILDPAGQVWLTDFGLAKRLDDVALSMTGALLGTPRYMSPEQASAAKQPVDQRTDIYSLGATLYELATGKPLFEADSPHGIISQILTSEPPAPRSLRTGLPRDLETIILKCLAKEPPSRYATAQALADDLRWFCEGRPIKARRAGLAERAARWARKNRRSVALVAAAAVVSTLLVVGGILISSQYHQSQLGHVGLKTDGPNLVAEVLEADQDRPVVASFTVPTTEPVALPAGSFRLRLSTPGQAAETTQLLVEPGQQRDYTVGLKQQLLWDPILLGGGETARVVKLKPSGWQVIRSQGENTLSLLNGASAQSVWQLSSTGWTPPSPAAIAAWLSERKDAAKRAGRPPFLPLNEYNAREYLANRSLAYEQEQDPPALVQPAPDLDGDGVGDLVWACRSSAALWALSGKAIAGNQGKELWWFSAGEGETVGVPAVADVDGDGTADFIATFADQHPAFTAIRNVWIEAVSGKTGKSLWRFRLEGAVRFAAQVIRLDGRPTVICAAGTRLVGLNPKTGKPLWPAIDLELEPIVPPQVADLDHDGVPDLLLVGSGPPNTLSVLALSLATRKPIWKKPLYTETWYPDPWNWFWNERLSLRALKAWPWVADLDGDGKAAVIVPIFAHTRPPYYRYEPWGGVELLDGATGQPQWQHRLKLSASSHLCDQLLVGPDIDGDGRRDLFVATTASCQGGRRRGEWTPKDAVFVDALSGKDGHTLWWWQSEMTIISESDISGFRDGTFSSNYCERPCFRATSLRLLSAGSDGWPQLVVPYNKAWWWQPETTAVLSTGTGRLQGKISDYDLVQIADLDHDGIDDLVFRAYGWDDLSARKPDATPRGMLKGVVNINGVDRISVEKLYAIRGTLPEMWRRLGNWRPAEDFDGDGIPDMVLDDCTKAISGRDGHLLWQSSEPYGEHMVSLPAHSDLDGDGTPDILALGQGLGNLKGDRQSGGTRYPIELHAISGRTGKRIWSAEDMVLEPGQGQAGSLVSWHPQVLTCRDLNGDGQLEIVLLYDLEQGSTHQLWLAALSLHDGKTRWRQALTDKITESHFPRMTYRPGLADLGGDGGLDLVIAVPVLGKESSHIMWDGELRAVSGRDGKLLWRQPLPVQVKFTDDGNAFSAPAIGNLGSNGKPQVVVMTQGWQKDQRTGADSVVVQVSSFDGRTGEPIWKHQPKWTNDSRFEPRVLLADIEGNGKVEVYASIAKRSDGNGSRPARVAHPRDGILLDAQGQVRPALERAIAGTFNLDGKEAFLLLGNHKLTVTRGGVKDIVWERSDVEYVREVLPAKSGQPSTVVVPSGNSLLGLDGATGTPLWRCPIRDAESILPAQDLGQPPWLISQADGSTVCRRALATTADGEYAPAVGTPCKDAPANDPRLVRLLPWVGHLSITSFAPGMGCIIYLLLLLVCTVRRRWRSLATWLAVFLVATVVIAVVFLWDDAQYVDPLEHYDVSGWYQVLYCGMIAAGAIVVPWFIARLVWLLGCWGVRRILARARAA